jgi:peptidoglycan hydrolase CwlO-like protein
MKTILIVVSLFTLLFIGYFYSVVIDNKSFNLINELSKQNDSLKQSNSIIYEKIESYNDSLRNYDAMIYDLNVDRNNLKSKISNINSKYNNLQLDYEKAKNHSDNFNSIELKSYFTDSLR